MAPSQLAAILIAAVICWLGVYRQAGGRLTAYLEMQIITMRVCAHTISSEFEIKYRQTPGE